jgi:hypothetical protein
VDVVVLAVLHHVVVLLVVVVLVHPVVLVLLEVVLLLGVLLVGRHVVLLALVLVDVEDHDLVLVGVLGVEVDVVPLAVLELVGVAGVVHLLADRLVDRPLVGLNQNGPGLPEGGVVRVIL